MDSDDMSYLSYLTEKPQSLLLQSSDEGLGLHYSSINVEPMFTDITDGTSSWAIDGLPNLMNNSFIIDQNIEPLDRQNEANLYANNTEVKEVKNDGDVLDSEILSFPIDVPGKGILTSNGLFLANDVLLQFNTSESVVEESNLNPELANVYTENSVVKKGEEIDLSNIGEDVNNIDNDNDVIQLLNPDGSLVTISKQLLAQATSNDVTISETILQNQYTTNSDSSSFFKAPQENISLIIDSMFQEIVMKKCLKCGFICEEKFDMVKHIFESHVQQIVTSPKNVTANSLNVGTIKNSNLDVLNPAVETKKKVAKGTKRNVKKSNANGIIKTAIVKDGIVNKDGQGVKDGLVAKDVLALKNGHVVTYGNVKDGNVTYGNTNNYGHVVRYKNVDGKILKYVDGINSNDSAKNDNSDKYINGVKYENSVQKSNGIYNINSAKNTTLTKTMTLNTNLNDTFKDTNSTNYTQNNVKLKNVTNVKISNPPSLNSIDPKNGQIIAMRSLLNPPVGKADLPVQNNGPQTVYLCSVCNKRCLTTDELKSHMIIEHKLVVNIQVKNIEETAKAIENEIKPGVSTLETDANGKEKSSKSMHETLVQSQEKAKKIKCSVKGCNLRFAQDAHRIRHEKCHVEGQKKQFKCTVCNKIFSIWRICSLHIWKCHKIDVGLLTCPMCNNFKTLSAYNLLNHMQTHSSEYPFVCSFCGKSFKQMAQLRNHHVVHRGQTDDLPNWASQQKCDQCGNYFSNSKSLKKHIQQVHNKFKPFICNVCGHKTTRKAMLQLHLRQHTGEKPHKCTICQYSTGDHNSLRRHMMRHNGSAKYSCLHCEYKCIQSISLKVHISKKHPGMGGTYTCLLCSFTFINENTYNSHMQEHRKQKDREQNIGDVTVNNLKEDSNSSQPADVLDDEMQSCFLSSDHTEDTVDTGGITIPAGVEINELHV